MTVIHRIREKDTKVPCPHCYGGHTTDMVETSFEEFEEVFVECPMCLGAGRAMSKAERKARRS